MFRAQKVQKIFKINFLRFRGREKEIEEVIQ